ncbi:MAG: uroporphyrinogen decarboxylase family protein [bacterium]
MNWKPDPDFSRFRKALLREGEPDRVPFYELFADPEIMEAVLGEPITRLNLDDGNERKKYLRAVVRFYHSLGYDYLPLAPKVFPPRDNVLESRDTADLPREKRTWVDEHRGMIETRKDFERYPWPSLSSVNFSDFEFLSRNLPEGMKVIGGTSGVLENVMWLMGYEPLSYALYDDPNLVGDMFRRVGEILSEVHREMAEFDCVGALYMGDDMGYKTGTMIAPELLKKHVFPWQKRAVSAAHSRNLPFILHSCGNLEAVMDDLIDYVGIDAKHSYEDAILPVTEAKRLYGDRICILGGVDVDFICRSSEDDVRSYVRRVMRECGPGGGYALGTGNSVANYIPLKNYLAMLDEGRKVGKYPIWSS